MRRTSLVLAGIAAASAFTAPAPVSSRAGLTSVKMGQAPPPAKLELPKAKLNALEVNKKQWGIGAEGGAAPAAKAAPAPKKAAAKKAAAAGAPASVDFSRPDVNCPSGYPAEDGTQTFLGMAGPRAPGHREKFGSKHTAVSLALAALLFQPIANSGMYTMDQTGALSRSSFNNLEVPGMGERKTV